MADLAQLRAMMGCMPARKTHSFSLLEAGIPAAALTEVCGAPGRGKTEFVLRFLAEHPKNRVAWIEDELTAYPRAFPQHGVGLDRVLFVEGRSDSFWAVYQALRSGLFGAVVLRVAVNARLSAEGWSIELRRLQLAAERSRTTTILLSDEPTRQGAWPISLQVEVNRPDIRIKGGQR